MFQEEFEFFIKNQVGLVKKYSGKVLVLRGSAVDSVHNTPLEAYLAASEKFEEGTFMIQPCLPGPDAYTVSISAANSIAIS